MGGTAQKHFWTAQPPFFEGIIEHEVPVMDPHQGLGWEGKLLQSSGLSGYGTSASLLLAFVCTPATLHYLEVPRLLLIETVRKMARLYCCQLKLGESDLGYRPPEPPNLRPRAPYA